MSDIAVSTQGKSTSHGESMGLFATIKDVMRSDLEISLPKPVPADVQAGETLSPLEQLADRKAECIYRYIRSPMPAEYMKPLTESDLEFLKSLSLFERGVLYHYFIEDIREWIMGKPLIDGFRRFGEIRRKDNFIKPGEYDGFCYFMTRSRHEKVRIFLKLPKETRPVLRAYGIEAAELLGEKDPKQVLEEFRRIVERGFTAVTASKPRVETMEELIMRRVAEFAEIDCDFEAGRPEAGFQKAREFFGTSKA